MSFACKVVTTLPQIYIPSSKKANGTFDNSQALCRSVGCEIILSFQTSTISLHRLYRRLRLRCHEAKPVPSTSIITGISCTVYTKRIIFGYRVKLFINRRFTHAVQVNIVWLFSLSFEILGIDRLAYICVYFLA